MPQSSRSKKKKLFLPHPARTESAKAAQFPVFILLFLVILFCVHSAYASVNYRVRKGDSLARIAKRYKISVKKLKKENGLSSTRLKPGKELKIREAGRGHKKARRFAKRLHEKHIRHYAKREQTQDTALASKSEEPVIVKEKESVSIKNDAKVLVTNSSSNINSGAIKDSAADKKSTKTLAANENNLKTTASGPPPSIANIPEGALSNATTSSLFKSILEEAAKGNREAAAQRNYSLTHEDRYHKVRRGETLSSIARECGTSVKILKQLNGIRSKRARLKKGQKLLVKRSVKTRQEEEAPGTYRVRKGDTFFKIARKFHIAPEELMALNEMDTEDLRPGQTIMLAEKENNAPVPAADTRITAPQIESQIKELEGSSTLQSLGMKDRLMIFAKLMLNIPYRFGGSNFYGIDCSAFVQKVFNLLNVPLPRTARQQFTEGTPVDLNELAIGDLVFFRTYASFPSHVGIYIGQNLFIHASSGGRRVKIGSLATPYFMKRLIGAKRLLTGEAALPIPVSEK